MSNSSQIILNIEKYRAIKEASIHLNGITLISGENGCGKSTISKMLYYIFKISSSYNLLIGENLKGELAPVLTLVHLVIRDMHSELKVQRNQYLFELRKLDDRLSREEPSEEVLNLLVNQLDRLKLIIRLQGDEYNSNIRNRRLFYMFEDILKDNNVYHKSIPELFDDVIKKVKGIFKSAFKLINSRSDFLLRDELENIFHTDVLPSKLEVSELEEVLFSLDSNQLGIPYSIQNTLYIDTPMMLGEYSESNHHWNELNKIISNNTYKDTNRIITNIISNDVLGGDVSYEDDLLSPYNFAFRRNADKEIFNLLDCATGIKSFSILQFLLKLGIINNKTLLIFDEPESNLHPQWIVEYARIIVLINKFIKAKVLIATHNPDFVSAIRYISEKENVLDSVNFYIAEKQSDLLYKYKHLDKDIEPIFKSFNIALDRIEKYGV
ncbi:AAA ATPase domain-containing protein [Pasteurella multocida]|uniref:AAA family ATPase n=1 Tax=Pasteurella multocida TaxID=747 RepID=UPI0008EA0605|nr:AAA family ATPase [Pasteurella multocida]SFP41974.1 AAA ATPase domain-containing protein [Pasteurella multocida]VEE37359.1 cobalt transporter ATP-binding subunit [Pasteurella multocida subsp. gallicida]HEA3263252.1 AAA family ATPase [Pasteurella multocida]